MKTKNQKIIKTGPLTQNRLEPMENRLECSSRFPKPEKTQKHTTLIGPAH
jgi:hypothetical protein